MKTRLNFTLLLLLILSLAKGQEKLSLNAVLKNIENNNPRMKMSDAQIRSMDEAVKGARSWEAPQLGTGLWMVPYNTSLWKRGTDGMPGMGQYSVSAQQMFPNKKRQDAQFNYMQAASSVEKENKKTVLNELYANAKKNYFQWDINLKKDAILVQNEKMLSFMIKDSEIRYKNGLGKLSAYYKAKAALGNIQNMRIMLANDIQQQKIALNILMNRDRNSDFDVDTLKNIEDYTAIAIDTAYLSNTKSEIMAVERNIQLTLLKQNIERAK